MVRGNGSLVVLATVAVVFLLYYGAPFFIPLFVSLLIAYALGPVVSAIEKVVRVRALAAGIVVLSVIGLAGVAAWSWSDDVQRLWNEVPDAAKVLSKSLQKYVKPRGPSAITEVKKAAAELEAAAQGAKAPAASAPAAPAAAAQVSMVDVVTKAGKGAIGVATQVIAVLFLVFFMLASGDLYKRKLLTIAGERNKKRFTLQVLEQIDSQVHRYLLVLLVSNVLVGIGTWLAFMALGMNYSGLWGAAAGIVHTVPYFGPALIAAGSLVGAFVQFGDWSRALLVSGASILVAALVGQLFATWLASKHTEMNTTATFTGILFFGWIWGLWGVLLAIPILAIAKTVCEANEDWKPIAELLGR
ncbi:MAG TPA: AI-2E family transporter [Usitatibacter sp.]|nr:AI-2E family transporter [Usitatibacter sp.]